MKKTVLLIATCLTLGAFTNAQNVTIPDANFKTALLAHGSSITGIGVSTIDTNGDGEIQIIEAQAYTGSIFVSSKLIGDLTGIEQFTKIKRLDCRNNYLINLDISQNDSLTDLYCQQNQLTSLNLANGHNAQLIYMRANSNPNLTCIQHDALYTPLPFDFILGYGWQKDAAASWSDDCNSSSVLVSSITVQGQGGITTITNSGGTLQMEATVLPANASDGSYTWSVDNQSGAALIDVNGLLTAQTDGAVIVRATANDGSGVVGSATIGISNQTAAIENLALENIQIYPNPVNDELFIDSGKEKITSVSFVSVSGKVLKTVNNKQIESIDLSSLPQGIYFVKVSSEKGIATKKIIKK